MKPLDSIILLVFTIFPIFYINFCESTSDPGFHIDSQPPKQQPWDQSCVRKCKNYKKQSDLCGQSANAPADAPTNLTKYTHDCIRKCDKATPVRKWLCEMHTLNNTEHWAEWRKQFSQGKFEIFEGIYHLVSNPEQSDWLSFLEAMGYTYYQFSAKEPNSYFYTEHVDDDNYKITTMFSFCRQNISDNKYKKYKNDVTYGEEFIQMGCGFPHQRETKTIVNLEATNKWIWTEKRVIRDNPGKTFSTRHIWQFSEDGVKITWSTKGESENDEKTAVQYFARDPNIKAYRKLILSY